MVYFLRYFCYIETLTDRNFAEYATSQWLSSTVNETFMCFTFSHMMRIYSMEIWNFATVLRISIYKVYPI